jgi:hypothetical protein
MANRPDWRLIADVLARELSERVLVKRIVLTEDPEYGQVARPVMRKVTPRWWVTQARKALRSKGRETKKGAPRRG